MQFRSRGPEGSQMHRQWGVPGERWYLMGTGFQFEKMKKIRRWVVASAKCQRWPRWSFYGNSRTGCALVRTGLQVLLPLH